MTDSEILQALIDAEIALAGKGYPTAQATLTCERRRWQPGRPWMVTLYRSEYEPASVAPLIEFHADALTAILALSNAVEDVEPRPRDWTLEEVAATLGIAPEYQEAAE